MRRAERVRGRVGAATAAAGTVTRNAVVQQELRGGGGDLDPFVRVGRGAFSEAFIDRNTIGGVNAVSRSVTVALVKRVKPTVRLGERHVERYLASAEQREKWNRWRNGIDGEMESMEKCNGEKREKNQERMKKR